MVRREGLQHIAESFSNLSQVELKKLFGELFSNAVSNQEISIVNVGDPAFGAFSAVYKVELKSGDEVVTVAIKTQKDNSDIGAVADHYVDHLLAGARTLPSMMRQYGVYALSEEGQLITLLSQTGEANREPKETALQLVFQLLEAMPDAATQLLAVLRNFGLETIQSRSGAETSQPTMDIAEMKGVYQQIIAILSDIHTAKKPHFGADQQAVYQAALAAIVTDESRFDGVASCLDVSGVLSPEHVSLLRTQMLLLSELLSKQHSQRLSNVHGDAWASNFFMTQENKILCIDPGTVPYSDPALDVMFALADLLFLQVNTNMKEGAAAQNMYQGQFTELAEELLCKYQQMSQDADIRQVLPLFYGFKAFVSAVFDAGTNDEQRMNLYYGALGVVSKSVDAVARGEELNFSFTADALQSYQEYGRSLVTESPTK